MERQLLKKILEDFGYKEHTIEKMFQGKTRPKLLKAIELEKKHGIPCSAWQDLKSFISNGTKTTDVAQVQQTNQL